MTKAIIIAVLVTLLVACNTPFVAQPATQTPTPSITPQPTLTLTPGPTLIPLTLPVTAMPEVTVAATPQGSTRPELACKVLQQSVKRGSRFASKERFDISWMVKNTGTATWEPGVMELAYAGGSKMYQYQPVPLTHSSPPGDITILKADMVAPRTPDTYTMFWALRRGDEYFCRMSVTIAVHL
jgi:hypothetical protein